MKSLLFWLVVLGGCGFSACRGAVEADRFPFFKEVKGPSAAHSEVGGFVWDGELFSAIDDALANLRLLDQDGRETPFLVHRRKPTKSVVHEVPFRLETLALHERPSNRIEIVVQRKADQPLPCAVQFQSALRNFEKQVTVSGSPDRERWTALAQNEPIFDYARFLDVRNDRVNLIPHEGPFYKIEVANITENKDSPLVQMVRQKGGALGFSESEATSFQREPFRIDQLVFLERRETLMEGAAETRLTAIPKWEIVEDAKGQQTMVVFATERQPLAELTLSVADANFSRAVRLEGADVRNEAAWRAVAAGRFSAVHVNRIAQANVTLTFPAECRYRYYRLTMINQDNPPLALKGIAVKEVIYETLFFPKAGGNYRLYYGGAGIAAPRYDVSAVLQGIPAGGADLWRLGAARANAGFQAGRTANRLNGRLIFILAIAIMIGVLVVVIARAAKCVDKVAKP
jgi:hypothetical protein